MLRGGDGLDGDEVAGGAATGAGSNGLCGAGGDLHRFRGVDLEVRERVAARDLQDRGSARGREPEVVVRLPGARPEDDRRAGGWRDLDRARAGRDRLVHVGRPHVSAVARQRPRTGPHRERAHDPRAGSCERGRGQILVVRGEVAGRVGDSTRCHQCIREAHGRTGGGDGDGATERLTVRRDGLRTARGNKRQGARVRDRHPGRERQVVSDVCADRSAPRPSKPSEV